MLQVFVNLNQMGNKEKPYLLIPNGSYVLVQFLQFLHVNNIKWIYYHL